jgi:hypothetical protein
VCWEPRSTKDCALEEEEEELEEEEVEDEGRRWIRRKRSLQNVLLRP